ncbi:MAG: DUF2442 domain-containing protein [Tunicatimonas sp.]
MKPLIGKKTQAYLDALENKDPKAPDYYYAQMDALDKLIYEDGLRIQQIYFTLDLDLMLIVLNNRKVMKRAISDFKRLASATEQQLNEFENDGIGVHWPAVDEDLSLRGFLEHELANVDKPLAA